ncbi:TATA-box-binding protein-like [Drosophila hydei]|uniref:TATA box-binding protein-like 1 n=1 Tax=Drosophila hydei TaxID=7224 RepID=A0A6J1M5T7_DROHY|nr:TATA-box-binding protein-like [Drosophila hydei]
MFESIENKETKAPASTVEEKVEAAAGKCNTNSASTITTTSTSTTNAPPPSELDIVINNVVCSFSVHCHLKLREIALHGSNVEYRRENGMVTMRLRRPYTTASIWSSGRITCTGAISEPQAKVAARRYARSLGKLGFPVRFQQFRIVNVLGTCSMPWPIRIVNFSERHRDNASYEPELHPGVTFKMQELKATLKIFSTGSITVTAASVNAVESAIQRLYPLVHEFRTRPMAETVETESKAKPKIPNLIKRPVPVTFNAISMPMPMPMLNVKPGLRREQPTPPPKNTPSENICGNARRRATECWASKLQKKRPRFNDAGSMAIINAGNLARSVSGNKLSRKTSNDLDEKCTIQNEESDQLDSYPVDDIDDDDDKHW